ncbi:hypothetical protein Tco_0734931 [Tanacetum coccineum]
MDSENDNEKVMPSLPSPEPTISCFDDLDFFKDFENEFPAIVYNGAQTSKLDLLTELILNPQHIDEFDLNDETSVSEYNEKERNILYFNDLFLFNIIHPDDLKSEKDNDDNKIDIIQSSRGNEITQGSNILSETSHDKITKTFRTGSFVMNLNVNIVIWNYYGMLFYLIMNLYVPLGIPFDHKRTECLKFYNLCVVLVDFADMALPPRDQRHQYLRGLLNLMAEGLSVRMLIKHIDAQGQSVFTSRAWRKLFDIRGPLVHELILEFFSMFRFALGLHTAEEMQIVGFDFLGTTPSYIVIRDLILRLCHRLIACIIAARSQAPEKVTVTDLFYLRGMDVGSVNVPYLLAMYLRLFAAGRKSEAHISGEQFVARLAEHFRLLTVASGPKRQLDATAGAPKAVEDALVINEGDQAIPAPIHAPQPPPPPVAARTMPQRLGRLEEEMQGLCRDVVSLRGLVYRSITDQGMFSTWMISCMAQLIEASGQTYQAFDGTFQGSSHAALQRHTR